MRDTKISWCHHTFNAWTICTKLGEECRHCYAADWARRTGRGWGPNVPRPRTTSAYWRQPITWDKEAQLAGGERPRVFVGSLMDWAEDLPGQREILADLWALIRRCQHLDWLLLTKRPGNIPALLPEDWSSWTNGYPNVWLMASIGAADVKCGALQGPAIGRAKLLLDVPAVVHGISYEPALGPLAGKLRPFLHESACPMGEDAAEDVCTCTPHGEGGERRIRWVIYGAESGARRRRDQTWWATEMRDECEAAGAAFYYKQGSHRRPGMNVYLEGELHHDFPVPSVSVRREVPRLQGASGHVLTP